MIWFFQVVERLYGAGFEQYVQQHPSTEDRMKRVTGYLKRHPSEFRRWPQNITLTSGLSESDHNDRLVLN